MLCEKTSLLLLSSVLSMSTKPKGLNELIHIKDVASTLNTPAASQFPTETFLCSSAVIFILWRKPCNLLNHFVISSVWWKWGDLQRWLLKCRIYRILKKIQSSQPIHPLMIWTMLIHKIITIKYQVSDTVWSNGCFFLFEEFIQCVEVDGHLYNLISFKSVYSG